MAQQSGISNVAQYLFYDLALKYGSMKPSFFRRGGECFKFEISLAAWDRACVNHCRPDATS